MAASGEDAAGERAEVVEAIDKLAARAPQTQIEVRPPQNIGGASQPDAQVHGVGPAADDDEGAVTEPIGGVTKNKKAPRKMNPIPGQNPIGMSAPQHLSFRIANA